MNIYNTVFSFHANLSWEFDEYSGFYRTSLVIPLNKTVYTAILFQDTNIQNWKYELEILGKKFNGIEESLEDARQKVISIINNFDFTDFHLSL